MVRVACLGTVVLLLAGVPWTAARAWEHPFHSSLAEMEWNEKTGAFEVALSLWPVDVEAVLRAVPGLTDQIEGPLSIDDAQQRERLEPHLRDYVQRKFRAELDEDHPLEFHWLGFEVERKSVWCYFELKGMTQRQTVRFEDQLFFELQADQQNTILLRDGGKRQAIYFLAEKPTQTVDLAEGFKPDPGKAATGDR